MFPLIASIAFYCALLGLLISSIIIILEKRKKSKINLNKWIHLSPIIFAALAIILNDQVNTKIESRRILREDSLKKELSTTIIELDSTKNKLSKATTELESLNIESKKMSRGIIDLYSFDGKRIKQDGNKFTTIWGEEATTYQQIISLEKSENFNELIDLCEKQVEKTPDWLTPYLFLGIAYANTGQKEKAIINFKYIIKMAPGDPAYSDAKRFLDLLNQTN